MCKKRSNHTVYNVNTTSCGVRSTATRFSNQSRIRWSRVSTTCATNTTTRYCRCTSRPTTYTCSCQPTRNTHRAKSCGQSRALRRERCRNSTNRSWRSICGVADFGRNRTTSGRQEMFRPTRLSSISSERNTFSGAYGLHPRGQARGTRPAPPSRYHSYQLEEVIVERLKMASGEPKIWQ